MYRPVKILYLVAIPIMTPTCGILDSLQIKSAELPWGPGAAANFVDVTFLGIDTEPTSDTFTLIPAVTLIEGFDFDICIPFTNICTTIEVPDIGTPELSLGFETEILFGLQSLFGMTVGQSH